MNKLTSGEENYLRLDSLLVPKVRSIEIKEGDREEDVR